MMPVIRLAMAAPVMAAPVMAAAVIVALGFTRRNVRQAQRTNTGCQQCRHGEAGGLATRH